MTGEALAFQRWLVGRKKLAALTAYQYARFVLRGQACGDIPGLVVRSQNPMTRRVVLTAVKHWSEYSGQQEVIKRAERAYRKPVRYQMPTPASDQDIRRLLAVSAILDEPLRSVVTIFVASRFRFRQVSTLTREQVELGASGERIPVYRYGQLIASWLPAETVRNAMVTLLKLGDWDILQDLLGSTHRIAYLRFYRTLHSMCQKAGIKPIHPRLLAKT